MNHSPGKVGLAKHHYLTLTRTDELWEPPSSSDLLRWNIYDGMSGTRVTRPSGTDNLWLGTHRGIPSCSGCLILTTKKRLLRLTPLQETPAISHTYAKPIKACQRR